MHDSNPHDWLDAYFINTIAWINEVALNKAVQKILAFRQHRVHITPEDVLNILVETECISKSDLQEQIEEYKKTLEPPVIPKNYID